MELSQLIPNNADHKVFLGLLLIAVSSVGFQSAEVFRLQLLHTPFKLQLMLWIRLSQMDNRSIADLRPQSYTTALVF